MPTFSFDEALGTAKPRAPALGSSTAPNPTDVPGYERAFRRGQEAVTPPPDIEVTTAPAGPPAQSIWQRAGNLIHRVDDLGDRGIDRMAGGLGRAVATGADAVGATGVADWARNDAASSEARAAVPVTGATTWEDVKAKPSAGNIGSFIMDQGVGSVPDLVAMTAAPWLYGASRMGEIGQQRAVNNQAPPVPGVTAPAPRANLWDMAAAAPSAAVDVALGKFGVGGMAAHAGEGLLRGTATAAGKSAAMMGGQAVSDYAGTNLGTRQGFSLEEALDRGAAGIVGGAPLGIAGHMASHGLSKLAPAPPSPDLTFGSLDGGIDQAGHAPPTADLQSAGVGANQVMSPEFAALAAERLAAARERGGNMGVPGRKGAPEQVAPSTRAVPADTTIIGAPEGNVRSDDAGGIAGLDRKRAADSSVLDRAQHHVASDPVVSEILNANVSAQTKVATLWDRLQRLHEDSAKPDEPASDIPWQAPTAEVARSGGKPATGSSFDRMLGAESNHRQFKDDGSTVTSPKGAKGIAQVMPKTGPEAARDAGVPWDADRFANDPAYNEKLGRAYHDKLLRSFNGDEELAAAAYNAGPGRIRWALDKGGVDGWKAFIPKETSDYVRKVFGQGNPPRRAPVEEQPYRMSAPDEAGEGPYSSPDRVARNPDDVMSPPVREDFQGFEKTEQAPSATMGERQAGVSLADDSRMGTGGSTRTFKAGSDDPAGQPGFHENRARQMGAEAQAKAQADLEAEWARRADARRQRDQNTDASQRYEQERTAASSDPMGQYRGKYDQRPHQPTGSNTWATTPEGYVAGKSGNPVAFRNSKDAAKFAVQNQLGGDFDRVAWGANTTRVVLQRREQSTYGQESPATGTGPGFERPAPPAGRSADLSQRAIPAPEVATDSPAPPSAPPPTSPPPERPSAPYRAPESSGAGFRASGPPTEQVVTPNGPPIDTRFEVHDAPSLITSSHPSFDQRFQPRDRSSRATSDAQIAHIASNLDPHQLDSSRLASQGAPIVGPDRMVESGNGRVAAINRAYEVHPEKAAEYRRMIEAKGFDTQGMERPVLVRRRVSEMDDTQRAAFTRDAQDGGTMEMSAGERAKADAKSLPDELLHTYRGGDVNSAGNREFVRGFVDKVAGPNETNSMVQPDGSLSVQGIQRMRSALLAKAYDNPTLVERIVANPDSDIKAIGNVLTDLAPSFAQLRAKIAKGDLPKQFDITPQIGEIADIIARARAEERPISDFIHQRDIFSGDVDPVTEALANIMLKGEGLTKARSARDVSDGLQFYVKDAESVGPSLFGEDMGARAVEIAQAAAEKLKARDEARAAETGDMFNTRRAAREGTSTRSSEQSSFKLRGELEGISATHAEPQYRELAAKLSDIVGDDATLMYGGRTMESRTAFGEADPSANLAFVRRAGDHETVLHEAVHLAAMRRYGWGFDHLQPGDFAKAPVREFLSLFNEARDRFGGTMDKLTSSSGMRYALTSPDEFLSMALTNRATQRALERGSLWSRVVDGVRNLLGLQPSFKPLLDRVLRAGSDVLDAAKHDPVRDIGDGYAPSKRMARDEDREGFFRKVADHVVDTKDLARDFETFREKVSSPIQTLKDVTAPMRNMVSGLVFTNDGVMRSLGDRFKSPAIAELADHFHGRAGKGDGAGRTFHEAVQRSSITRIAGAHEALEPFLQDKAALSRIRDMLTNPDKRLGATAKEREAAAQLRDTLKETLEYRKAAGEDIGEVSNGYFPRVLDVEKVSKGREDFLHRAEKLYRSVGADKPELAAQAWFDRVFDQYSGLDGGLAHVNKGGGGGIGGNTAKAREFGKQADDLLKGYYHDDVFQTLASYFLGAARRAEETRRFGPKGAVGSKERQAWVDKHGDVTQLDELMGRVKEQVRSSDKDAGDLMHRLTKAYDSNMGRLGSVSNNTRTMISYVHAWNQISKMDRTLVTSLGELTMGFVRGGPKHGFHYVKDSVVEFGRQLANAHPSDAQRWSDAISVTQDAMVNQALTTRVSAEGSTQGVQKMMAGYYKGILLHQFTEGERTASTQMGRKMIQILAHDMVSPNARVRVRGARYLAELGVKDPDAFGAALRKGEPSLEDVRKDSPGLAADYTTALIRFVNQTVIAPNRAEKPALASHPVGSLFTSLLGYSFGFKKNVLDRAGRMAVDGFKEKDAHLLIPAMMLPIMGAFQYLNDSYIRPYLFGSNYDFSTETPTEAALRTADRAGFTGPMSPIINAFKGIKYRRSLAESLSGPALGTMASSAQKILTPFIGNNSPDTNSAERNAAAALYEAVIEPLADASAAKYLRGVPRTAGIMATGNKRGTVTQGRCQPMRTSSSIASRERRNERCCSSDRRGWGIVHGFRDGGRLRVA
ncbi:hypothetical protein D3Y57_07090 [Sphingomonas paeninsulae]|uniref:Transglycosylase SLT domain-containing protein n=1 Tax=Sphingomonas paeninsulae TaxID=2319844 RepID=A0A494TFK1_SPHPE|nr:transglycosylase SLT domain-containing protein [Sphingomonas paeninsulae]AYJ85783.1 hypothetical protein D3Y57_07090 [Sphingomonas paeninsulae]